MVQALASFSSKHLWSLVFATTVPFRSTLFMCVLIVQQWHFLNADSPTNTRTIDGHQPHLAHPQWQPLAVQYASNVSMFNSEPFHSTNGFVPLGKNQTLADGAESSLEHSHSTRSLVKTPSDRSMEYGFNRDYFDQINAHNHQPVEDSMLANPSNIRTSLSGPQQGVQSRSNENVLYYSPSAYGKSLSVTSTPKSTESQQSGYLYLYPNTTPAYSTVASSTDKTSSLQTSVGDSSKGTNHSKSKSVWSFPVISNSADQAKEVPDKSNYASTYSGELNKLLVERYYNQDLSSMTALLNKHHPSGVLLANSNGQRKQNTDSMDGSSDDDVDEESDDEDEDVVGEDNSDKGHESVAYFRKPLSTSEYLDLSKNKITGQMLSDYRVSPKSGDTLYRVQASPKLVRQYTGRSAVPVRFQTAHSHALPHYYIPQSLESGHHHHLGLPEKSGTWLGSGLAAGILIGAIPFGIMMASMMPTLMTGAMPIVNTAAVGKRRRRRSVEFMNLISDQTIDGLGSLLRKGVGEVIGLLNNPNMYKSTVYETNNPSNDLIKTVAKYALAAVDEPKCIKEMLCSLVASGRHSKTTPLQKTLYILIKWIPKDIERSLGLNDLFSAVRKDACFATYKCPVTVVEGMRRRSTTLPNARKMT